MTCDCLGVRVQGSGFRVQGAGFRAQGPGSRVQGSGSGVQGTAWVVMSMTTSKASPALISPYIASNLVVGIEGFRV